MTYRRSMRALATGCVLAGVLAACGGGDDWNGPTTGGWTGTTDSNRDVAAVLVPDGTYYLMYSAVGDPNTVGGVVQGTSTLDGETFGSSDGLDFSAEGAGIRAATVAGNIHHGSFDGTETPATGAALGFQTRYDVSAPAASLGRLAGTYEGTAGFALGVRPATFTVGTDGAVSSVINGCSITGTATPRTDIPAYDLALAFGGAPCAIPNLAFSGIAYLRGDNGRLVAAARNEATKQSVIFDGGKI